MQKNYYQILGLNPNCDKEEIKKAFRNYAFKFHPDKHANDPFFTERFKEIKEAYDILSNDNTREKYDSLFKSSNNSSSSSNDKNYAEYFRRKNEEEEKRKKASDELKERLRKNIYYVDDKITVNGLNIFINNKTFLIDEIDFALVKKSDSSEYKSYAIILIIIGIATFTFFIGIFILAAGISGLFYKDYILLLYYKNNEIPILRGKKKYLSKIANNINSAIQKK